MYQVLVLRANMGNESACWYKDQIQTSSRILLQGLLWERCAIDAVGSSATRTIDSAAVSLLIILVISSDDHSLL